MFQKPLISLTFAVALAAGSISAHAQAARDFINVVGSSTVYPFTTAVAEQLGRQGRFKTPKVESTGTGGGIKLFCNGVGPQHPDVANASRRMNANEFATCQKNGVKDILEVRVGYDGLTLSESKRGPTMNLTPKMVYLALAKQVPDPANPSALIANPYKNWRDIDKSLPNIKIEVLGPPPTSGTRDSFHELYMETGCRTYPWIDNLRKMDEKRFKRICHTIREDGAYVEAGADMIFPEAMTELPMYGQFKAAVKVPILANITEFGHTPLFTTEELASAGIDMALYPLSAFRAMNLAALKMYQGLREKGTQSHMVDQMQTRAALYEFLGYHEYEAKLDELFLDEKAKES